MELLLVYLIVICPFYLPTCFFFWAQWDQHIDVTTTLSLPARPTTAVCLCGLSATATTTAEMTVMSRDVVSLDLLAHKGFLAN